MSTFGPVNRWVGACTALLVGAAFFSCRSVATEEAPIGPGGADAGVERDASDDATIDGCTTSNVV